MAEKSNFGAIFNWLLWGGLAAWGAYAWAFPSPQQLAKNEAARPLCQLMAVCKKYSETRLECATAGSLKTCLQIKMGKDYDLSDNCLNDSSGKLEYTPTNMPSAFQCFLISPFGNWDQ
jgi:hypothetical protein